MPLDWTLVPLALSAATGITLGLVLARYGIDRPAHRALALFLGLHGVLNLTRLLGELLDASAPLLFAYERYFWLADGLMLFAFVAVYPGPRRWLPRPLTRLWPYLALLAAFDLVYLVDHAVLDWGTGRLIVIDNLFDLGYAVAPLVLAATAYRKSGPPTWPSVALLSAGIPLYFLHIAASSMVNILTGVATEVGPVELLFGRASRTITLARAGLFLALLALVAERAWRGPVDKRLACRHHAAWILAPIGTGVVSGFAPDQGLFEAGLAVWFFATPAILAYALLRHQLLGVDVKVRFAISKTTIAGAFIAVFFTASEGAQILFGAANEWFGLAAAGALVFAMAPLQRAAERLAERAVPVVAGARVADGAAHEDAYRAAVRLALRGGITRREEFELARIAEAYGIAPVRALEIRDDVERTGTGHPP